MGATSPLRVLHQARHAPALEPFRIGQNRSREGCRPARQSKKHYIHIVGYCHAFERTKALPYGFSPTVKMTAPMGPRTIAASSRA